ncbi:MAG: putative metal-dependent phosphoesterase TrpH, contains PHP domain [Verrucomicrobia bacterium]|nr:MAG: putative metal-dependent phosphoesterase TrpH, contains PHP domain [Verrucomicrobiota bacterium]
MHANVLALTWILGLLGTAVGTAAEPARWYRGNTHTHSLWSDGNDFPEMIVGWYQEHGYDFIALSDHNVLPTTEKWMGLEQIQKRQKTLGRSAFDKYLAKYGTPWVETREVDGTRQVRIKKLSEYRPLFESPGKFLVLQAEEVTNSSSGKPVHINAVNVPGETPIPAINAGTAVQEIIRETMRRALDLEKRTGQAILVHLNHPNFQWGVSADALARAVEERFFEVYNGHPSINHLGEAGRPGDEAIWDICNAIRLKELRAEPLYGLATDDSHQYHGGSNTPGRGWIMVKAASLSGNHLVEAMRRGDFYASSGVRLRDVSYDPGARKLRVGVEGEPGITYRIRWIGTRTDCDLSAPDPNTNGIGAVLREETGTEAEFNLPADLLYARAVIVSSRPHPNPSYPGQLEQAWTQPVGWK